MLILKGNCLGETKVRKTVLSTIIVLLGLITLTSLWLNNVEMWNSQCAYKREMGVFAYYSYADLSSTARNCGETGVNWFGLIKTILASTGIIALTFYARNLITPKSINTKQRTTSQT